MAKPVTEETLRTFLTAHGVNIGPGQDVSATASNLLADWVAEAAAERPKLVKDPNEVKDQLVVFAVAEQALRRNPFSDATGKD
mmetsp:Transcript_16109/g.40116  ORF Transcript_16109/g.40116 Transcript_16109/m.40116 type:complete len:83 (-) Transcript_16109:1821-2069(-)